MADVGLLREAARLAADGEPFAVATVVRREAPSSAWPGWKAIVRRDGSLRGWLGGACIEPTVVREAVQALRDGRPRLVVFAPDAGEGPAGSYATDGGGAAAPRTATYPMTCHSGGTVEVYIDPQRPSPVLRLFGDSPVTRALGAMGSAAGYAVWTEEAAAAGERPTATGDAGREPETEAGPRDAGAEVFAVVATMGEWDEDAVERALRTGASYVGLVASPRRAADVRRLLAGRGVDEEQLERLRSPAGLDLGAREPGEIAVTILAEIVALRHASGAEGPAAAASAPEAPGSTAGASPDAPPAGEAVDPVCGMTVSVEGARHVARHAGDTYRFCCPGCRERFLSDPAAYVSA